VPALEEEPEPRVKSDVVNFKFVQLLTAWLAGLEQRSSSSNSSSSSSNGIMVTGPLLTQDDLEWVIDSWPDLLGQPLGSGGEGMVYAMRTNYEVILRLGSTSAADIRVPVALKVTKITYDGAVGAFKEGVEKAAALAAANSQALPPMAAWVQRIDGLVLPKDLVEFLGGCTKVGITLMPQLRGSVSGTVSPLWALVSANWLCIADTAMRLQLLGLALLLRRWHVRDFKGGNVLVGSGNELWVADTG
jgi:hypothetical protein